ncbi:hypothetical protein COCSUDRAFT_63953 [Coccomyxa subellipsoidea C-169]|uniref:Uncharacterized protein n=1 Tax=Coccomyxa subellipsoidea (strain C-169) TaxID=574566 RepID=I0YWQ4_COCSC|nr:hypothetical protein COCSUDRAFT_63953 [Coccomyxa subellipsoidea C-169]EIE22823.1 hypothetical protein COCSUDRAFT_63953 [Coccomyxa subellipsoidea C-169]|eukprot:XP_005647367.1 hypothetical protein COCSUDRAFT_63953 [Coccomyxa subellipsoidea C-169]
MGRLIAEAGSLEDENAWLNAQLKETQSDKWYLEIAKSGLEDRVAHLAAALVEGMSEQLDLRCAEQKQSLKALHARLDAAEAEVRRSAQLQRARLMYLNLELELCRDRRARQALERVVEVLSDPDDALLAASSSGGQEALRESLLHRSRSSAVGTAAGCWPVGFGSKKGMSRNSSSSKDQAVSASAPASLNPPSPLTRPPLEVTKMEQSNEDLQDRLIQNSAFAGSNTPPAHALSPRSSGQYGSEDMSWAAEGASSEDDGPQISPHTALGMAATPSGRLAFAHSVMPMISNIGRQLAAQYSVVFDSGRVRAPQLEAAELDCEDPDGNLD